MIERVEIKDIHLYDLNRTLGNFQTMIGASSTITGKTLGHHKSAIATTEYIEKHLYSLRESIEMAVEAMKATRELPEKFVKLDLQK